MGKRHDLISDVDNSPAVEMAGRELFAKLNTFFAGKRLDKGTVRAVEQLIYDERVRAKVRHGVRLPELVVMPLPRQQAIEVVRRDLDRAGIANIVRRFAGKYPGITPLEIATAVRYAFPQYAAMA